MACTIVTHDFCDVSLNLFYEGAGVKQRWNKLYTDFIIICSSSQRPFPRQIDRYTMQVCFFPTKSFHLEKMSQYEILMSYKCNWLWLWYMVWTIPQVWYGDKNKHQKYSHDQSCDWKTHGKVKLKLTENNVNLNELQDLTQIRHDCRPTKSYAHHMIIYLWPWTCGQWPLLCQHQPRSSDLTGCNHTVLPHPFKHDTKSKSDFCARVLVSLCNSSAN